MAERLNLNNRDPYQSSDIDSAANEVLFMDMGMQNILTALLQSSAAGAVELSKTGEHIQKVARN